MVMIIFYIYFEWLSRRSKTETTAKGRQSVNTLPAFFYALNLSSSSIKQNRPNVLLTAKKFNLFRLGAPSQYNPNQMLVTSEWFGFTFYLK